MHYDLRLELDGVLKSWAVPNGFSADTADKRLAVMTEDHPYEYLSWEGVIPKGNYGAGEMIVWDHGIFWPEEDNQPPPATREESAARFREGVRKGRMKLTFEGQKLRGSWNLVKSSRSTKDWLLIRRSGGPPPRLDDERSVLSGLTLADLRAGRTTPTARPSLADVPGAKKAPFPREMEPMNANPAAKPFVHPDWIFEPKLDGYRAFAFVKPGEVRMTSRRGNDTTALYPAIEDELAALGREMVLDGEVVALDEAGCPTIQALTTQLEGIRRAYQRSARAQFPLLYYAFDLLYLDGYDLRGVQLEGRKRLLREALTPGRTVKLMEHFENDGVTAYEAAVAMGLEGMVGKHRRSLYQSGRRSPQWLKLKSLLADEFVVGGWTHGKGGRAETIGSLLVGQYQADGALHYLGHVGTGFETKTAADLRKRFVSLAAEASPFDEKIPKRDTPTAWVRPEMVVEVSYQGLGNDGHLRFPVYTRLRDDKAPVEVQAIQPAAAPPPSGPSDSIASVLQQLSSKAQKLTLHVDAHKVNLTNLDKQLWPNATKRDLLRYLAHVSPYALPHLRDRPLTLIRYPDGIDGQRFYQKHVPATHRPDFLETVVAWADHSVGDQEYPICNNLATLLWLGQMGALELHSQYCRIVPSPDGAAATTSFAGSGDIVRESLLNYPDYVVFDLDPVRLVNPSTPAFDRDRFKKVCDAAQWLREMLDSLKLSSFVKTTGRSGLHVFVPIERKLDFDATRSISRTIADFMRRAHPREITTEFAIQKRVGDVFVDWNQNVRGKTLTSIYSPRATPEASISAPLRWDEVGKLFPHDITIHTAPARLAEIGDVWGGVLEAKADLAASLGDLAA